MKRKRNRLSDIGPRTRRLFAVRDGIRGMRKALDRGACRDAAALLRLTEREMRTITVDANTQDNFDAEKDRLKHACKTSLGKRRRKARRR